MHDDLPDCATDPNVSARIKFIYDYNTKKNDLFSDHVGTVYLYVFDQDGVFLERREHTREYTSDPDFVIMMDSTELTPGKSYQFLAVANGNHYGYEASLATPGFQKDFDLIPGVSTISDYKIKLDVDNDGDVDIFDQKQTFFDQNIEQLDTVWTTLSPQIADIPRIKAPVESPIFIPDTVVDVTIPLMRITNHVKVNLVSNNFTMATNPYDYTLKIHFPNGNGEISFTGETLSEKPLDYHSIRKRMESTETFVTETTSAKLAAEFNVSRLQSGDGSKFQVYNSDGTRLIGEVKNFSGILAAGNDAYAIEGWSAQEYLDREYDFEVDFQIDDNNSTVDDIKFLWVDVRVSVLGWAQRIQFEKL